MASSTAPPALVASIPNIDIASLPELLQCRAQHQPNQRAYTFLVNGEAEAVHITYGELEQTARAIAARLSATVTAGDRALLIYPQGLDFIAGFFGCLYAGVIAVPVALPKRNKKAVKLAAIAANSQAKIALTTTDSLTLLEPHLLADDHKADGSLEGSSKGSLGELGWLTTDTVLKESLRHASETTSDWPVSAMSLADIDPQAIAFLQYTSGSTGTPKGVMVSHQNLLHNSQSIQTATNLSPQSISVTWLPSFHDMGLIDGIIQPLYTGFLGVLMPPGAFIQKPLRWLQAISHYRATHSGGPNLGYELCTNRITPEQISELDLSCWKRAYSGSEPIRAQTLKAFTTKFADCGFSANAFYPCYGMAEATLLITSGQVAAPPMYCTVQSDALAQNRIVGQTASHDHKVSEASKVSTLVGCGHTHLNTQVVIVNPETKIPCEANQVGEIWVTGSGIAQGYWNLPEQTQQTFGAYLADSASSDDADGPYLRTGDLGFLKGHELFITGRLKDAIIIWGRNHYPQDIELTVAQSHRALRSECGAAFAVEVAGEERLVIVQEVERTHLRHLAVDEVVNTIRQAVADHHDLQVYAVALIKTATIHKTSSGKIQRRASKVDFMAGELNVVGEWAEDPSSEDAVSPDAVLKTSILKTSAITEFVIQDWLIEKIAQANQQDPDEIEIEASFADYALSSSVAMSLTGELADWLGCPLEPTLFWEYPNIEVLSQFLMTQIAPG